MARAVATSGPYAMYEIPNYAPDAVESWLTAHNFIDVSMIPAPYAVHDIGLIDSR